MRLCWNVLQTAVEARHGVSGYRNTQDAIENVSTMKSEFDSMKGRTLEDMSDMVQQFNSKIANKRAALEPIVRELRSVRQQAQVVDRFDQLLIDLELYITESVVLVRNFWVKFRMSFMRVK